MSEEIEYDGNHLSTTEDAFEQFQSSAVAHVEESDEYITLSDIVPPQPEIPNLDDELNEIPYDNEVILTSNEEANRVNNSYNSNYNNDANELLDISGGSSAGQNYRGNFSSHLQSDGIPHDVEIYNSNGMQRNVDVIQNRTYNDELDLNEYDIGGQDFMPEDNQELIQDSVLSTTVGKNGSESGQSAEKPNVRRTRRGRIPNTLKYPLMTQNDINNVQTPGKRRGRPPKKAAIEKQAEPDSTNSRENSGFDGVLNDVDNTTTPKPKRVGRPKKSKSPSKDDLDKSKTVEQNLSQSLGGNNKRGKTKKPKPETTASSLDSESNQADLSDLNSTKNEDVSAPSVNKRSKGKTSKLKKAKETTKIQNNTTMDDDEDDADDMSLSKLKQITSDDNLIVAQDEYLPVLVENQEISEEIEIQTESLVEIENEVGTTKPVDGPPEISVEISAPPDNPNELLVEDTTKRNRRSAKKTFHYDEGSDEDPFANIESSEDDTPKRRKKGTKYYSDDEYVPDGSKAKGYVTSSNTDSEINEEDDGDRRKLKRKIIRKKSDTQSPRKKGKISNTDSQITSETDTNPKMDNDIEVCLEPTVISVSDDYKTKPPAEAWATSNEFENFIAQKIQGTSTKIKKVSNTKRNTEKSVPPLPPITIPVLEPAEPKKTVEIGSQTEACKTTSVAMQTSAPFDIPMKSNKNLTKEQSEKACEFLKSVVKTTSELGQLMTEKSEDFMKKKINMDNMTDTFKMDYCVRKSFLLFKLAKHNLIQMEDDLAKQYDEFLKTHGLSSCRDDIKKIAPKIKEDDDSDCEIVGEVKPVMVKPEKQKGEKPKFNAKTVFLNKELSIKIAKKPTVENAKKIDIKSRHAVWINDSVMVKKVKPNQSFLAQDSRNKKPPDHYVTEEMVRDFFNEYYRRKAVSVCAPFVSTEWTLHRTEYVCHYFLNCEEFDEHNEPNDGTNTANDVESLTDKTISNPKTLLTLCTDIIHLYFNFNNNVRNGVTLNYSSDFSDKIITINPLSLSRICLKTLSYLHQHPQPPFTNEPYSPKHVNEPAENAIKMILSPEHVDETSEEIISTNLMFSPNIYEEEITLETASPLKTLCYRKIAQYFTTGDSNYASSENYDYLVMSPIVMDEVKMKSLFSLCVEAFQNMHQTKIKNIFVNNILPPILSSPKSLKSLVFNVVKNLNYLETLEHNIDELNEQQFNIDEVDEIDNFTINCVNTLTDEAFQNLEEPECHDTAEYSDEHVYENDMDNIENDNIENDMDNDENDINNIENDMDNIENDMDNDENDMNNIENDTENNSEWISQLQVQELRSCVTLPNNEVESNLEHESGNAVFDRSSEHEVEDRVHVSMARVKLEPIDDFSENIIDPSNIKTEPLQGFNGMTIIPESIVTKTELIEHVNERLPGPEESSAFDGNIFENFVSSNKMMYHAMSEYSHDEIFSQSALRIRRQHEPDFDEENDSTMSLLEPLNVEHAKGSLMESSSDNENTDSKKGGKKKIDKRKKKYRNTKETKNNKNDNKTKDVPLPTKDKPVNNSEVAVLTRRMRDRIRQEEKKVASSESESENLPQNSKKGKKEKEKLKNDKQKESDEIQCNNVDSTETITADLNAEDDNDESFAGFSPVDQNEVENFQKHMRKAFEALVPEEAPQAKPETPKKRGRKKIERIPSPVECVEYDEPAEEISCEPTLPILDDTFVEQKKPRGPKKITKTKEPIEKATTKPEEVTATKPEEVTATNQPSYTERHGWHCYPMTTSDPKLYQNATIYLEKLPESFVETYFEYQEITDKDKEDEEVDRLVNLQSLSRGTVKDGKQKSRQKVKTGEPSERASREGRETSPEGSGSSSPTYSDHYAELSPSEDEDANVEDEVPPALPLRSTENVLAKNSLMDDHDSDDENGIKKVKEEPNDTTEIYVKPGPKSKKLNIVLQSPKTVTKVEKDLMLTADKMMNKELTMLHAPVVLTDDQPEIKVEEGTSTKPSPPKEGKTRQKSTRTATGRDYKNDGDSSSDEEKQWVNTKEKLLKKMGKKEDATVDDAKRAKLVTEFIERRNDLENRKKSKPGRRMSKKKMLEREKQLRVLSKELFGESSIDATHAGNKKGTTSLFKGRRNIRAVIDKKSLARSTVLANMEEFERKRRLSIRHNQLRELLGCEEGVNVLVINDEVCLEYDFNEHQPVVSVHQFFTSVMKAHQYEGVKFMWDACFESIKHVEEGHKGGGCILAHCMGLGKTLQVLALLHTVLTHPRVGMHRVLVCCPLSTVLNWVDEIHKWLGPVTNKIKVFELSKLRKTYERAYQLEDWYNGGGIFIIGYELFRSLTTLDPLIDDVRPSVLKKIRTALLDPGPDIIVCDEGHLLKNDCSVLAVAMSRVVTKRRIVLTGTPMQNNLREYYCMVNFVKPNLLGTYSEYSNRFENPIMNGQHRDSREEDIRLMKARTHILHKVLEGCLQRQEASVLYPYLPKKHEYTVFIPLTTCQWDLYKHYILNYTNQHLSTKSKPNVLKDFHILQKIWSHPQVLHNFQTKKRETKIEKVEDDLALEDKEDIKPPETETWWLQYLNGGTMLDCLESSNKFVAVFRILHECVLLGDKVLIFSTSLSCLDALEYFLRRINGWHLGHDYYRLDGSVPAEVRQKWCREFNAEHNIKTKLFLISTRAGCLGLNMTAANRVIILDTSWNPAHDIQSIFRVYRFGQKKDCYIYRLVAMGTMEQKIYERSVTKQAVACRVVDEQQIDRHYNMADLNELYRYDESGSGVAGGVAVGVCDVALLRVARDAALHAVHEHDSLLRGGAEAALPEHEREHAWAQFQQEHATKQMQNDLDQRNLQIAAERARALAAPPFLPPPGADAVEPFSVVPRRGRPTHAAKLAEPPGLAPAPAHTDVNDDIVHQISNILLKHDAAKFMDRPEELAQLVTRVRSIVESGGAGAASLDADDLTASIAAVMLRDSGTSAPPPLTNVAPGEARRGRGRGRPRKEPVADEPPPPPPHARSPTPPEVDVDRHLPSNRALRKRKAALVAETRFDTSSGAHDDVIDLDSDDEPAAAAPDDDEEWLDPDPDPDSDSGAGAVLSVDHHGPAAVKPEPTTTKLRPGPLSKKAAATRPPPAPAPDDSSILLSDDETIIPLQSQPEPLGGGAGGGGGGGDDELAGEEVPLHPSLLANQNFLKIVAHTYLAGNPMLTEDAAVLAAQYSILKTMREAEAAGGHIVDGPIYDIAVKVLGKSVIKKVFEANPKTKDQCAEMSLTTSLNTAFGSVSNPKPTSVLLEPKAERTEPSTSLSKKPKIGPKSKVKQAEPAASPAPSRLPPQAQKATKLVPFKIVNNKIQMTSQPATGADECILPDDADDVVPAPLPSPPPSPPPTPGPAPSNPNTYTRKQQLQPSRIKIAPRPTQQTVPAKPSPMQPAPVSICLDSDEEDGGPSGPAPVPIALTGPNSQAIPLSFIQQPRPPAPPPPPARAPPQIIRVTRPPAPPRPVPVSLTGPNAQPIPISVPSSSVSTPTSFVTTSPYIQTMSGKTQPVPVSLTGPNAQQLVFAQGANGLIPISMIGDSNLTQRAQFQTSVFRTPAGGMLTLQLDPNQATSQAPPSASNIILMPNQKKLIRVAKTEVPNIIRIGPGVASPASPAQPTPAPVATPAPIPVPPLASRSIPTAGGKRTYCKPGDIFRVSETGELEVIEASPAASQPPISQAAEKLLNKLAPKPSTPPKILNHAMKEKTPPPAARPQRATRLSSTLKQKSPPPPTQSERATRSQRTSSSSHSSRSSSPEPDDPLSILKDVVHIQAPPKQNKPIKPIATPAKLAPLPTPPATPTPTKTKTSNTNPPLSNTDNNSLFHKLKPIGNQSSTRTPTSTKSSAKAAATTKTDTKPIPRKFPAAKDTTTAKSTANKEKPQQFASIDLTDVTVTATTSNPPNRKLIKLTSEPTFKTKNISVGDQNKTIVNMVDLTSQGKPKAPAPSTSKVKVEPKLKTDNKRPAPKTETAPAKKKKTELMTLKDFDIDDIDDIIELD